MYTVLPQVLHRGINRVLQTQFSSFKHNGERSNGLNKKISGSCSVKALRKTISEACLRFPCQGLNSIIDSIILSWDQLLKERICF